MGMLNHTNSFTTYHMAVSIMLSYRLIYVRTSIIFVAFVRVIE